MPGRASSRAVSLGGYKRREKVHYAYVAHSNYDLSVRQQTVVRCFIVKATTLCETWITRVTVFEAAVLMHTVLKKFSLIYIYIYLENMIVILSLEDQQFQEWEIVIKFFLSLKKNLPSYFLNRNRSIFFFFFFLYSIIFLLILYDKSR